MEKPFIFKQFSITQDRSAMKIGTDGVILGAWADLEHRPFSILDVGTGTGVIALMLAQRSTAQLIDALELDENAYEQATENFENSDWSDRLFCYHASFDEFVEEMQDEEKYELIVSNPPFYSANYSSGDAQRDQARFANSLPFSDLLKGVSRLLAKNGKFCVVFPYAEENDFVALAADFLLYPQRFLRVRGTPEAAIKRSYVEFGFEKITALENELIIETQRHQYTPEYIELVRDFYLKM